MREREEKDNYLFFLSLSFFFFFSLLLPLFVKIGEKGMVAWRLVAGGDTYLAMDRSGQLASISWKNMQKKENHVVFWILVIGHSLVATASLWRVIEGLGNLTRGLVTRGSSINWWPKKKKREIRRGFLHGGFSNEAGGWRWCLWQWRERKEREEEGLSPYLDSNGVSSSNFNNLTWCQENW